MNEYELKRLNVLVLLGTLATMLYVWGFSIFITREIFSILNAALVSLIGLTGLVFSWIISSFRKEYSLALEKLLSNASRYKPLCTMIVQPKTSEDESKKPPIAECKSLRWSVQRYRGYEDFVYGSFDIYVTKEEIVIRGRLKRGQPSLYMKIGGPFSR